MNVQTIYQHALAFAARKHDASGEKVKGTDLPYLVHVVNVAMEILIAAPQSGEFDLALAVQVALLHDTVEDTNTTIEEIEQLFGHHIAVGVQALTKDESLPEDEQIKDSVRRIKSLPKEIGSVKLADRITNLMPPPAGWSNEKIKHYIEDSKMILKELQACNIYLANRLVDKIKEYSQYL